MDFCSFKDENQANAAAELVRAQSWVLDAAYGGCIQPPGTALKAE